MPRAFLNYHLPIKIHMQGQPAAVPAYEKQCLKQNFIIHQKGGFFMKRILYCMIIFVLFTGLGWGF
jgi:hypothetical protein